jgi:aspartate carbamoyltransferase catalytic subunit
MWTRKHLLGLEELSREELLAVLDLATTFKKDGRLLTDRHDTLKGKTVLLLFFEPSTRTAMSFQAAAKRLSADVVSFSKATSSTTKGETLVDTAKNIEAMGPIDIAVLRHSSAGAPQQLARAIGASIVNAGDGAHEHPTQGLLDIFTIREKLGSLKGLKVAIVGDIAHSRVARSNIFGLKKLGADVTVCGPATLLPAHVESLGVKVNGDFDDVLPKMDVINMLRIQKERMAGPLLLSDREYTRLFGLTREREKRMKPGAIVMHPGPTNRGVEIDPEVADGPRSVILEQVANGVAVRMAVLSLVAK